jgi:hypothetical protein
VTEVTDPTTGAETLRVVTTGQNDTVNITDNSTKHTTTVVADGKTTTFDEQFSAFDLQLLSKKDTLTFQTVGPYDARVADIQASLGTGENHFTFNPDKNAIQNHSDVNVSVQGHGGTDFVNLSFGQIAESRVNVVENNIGGSKTKTSSTAPPSSSITFGDLKTGIRGSSVDVNVNLGHGTNNFAFNYGADLGHLNTFSPSTMNVTITGSNRPQDAANVTLNAVGEVNTQSTLNFNVQFIAGNNSFKSIFDANSFQIDDDGGATLAAGHAGGAAHFTVHGGTGNDNISFQSINQAHTIELSGLLDINAIAGTGNDKINIDFGGPGGFTDDDPFELLAANREFRARVIGGSGNDQISMNLSNANTATFAYDVAILGGTGKDNILFAGVNAGGSPTFGPAGSVLIDASGNSASTVDVFGNFPVDVLRAMP